MTVIGSIDEINEVLQFLRPGFPRQNLESIKSNNCFYVFNEVPVEIVIYDTYKRKECPKA